MSLRICAVGGVDCSNGTRARPDNVARKMKLYSMSQNLSTLPHESSSDMKAAQMLIKDAVCDARLLVRIRSYDARSQQYQSI